MGSGETRALFVTADDVTSYEGDKRGLGMRVAAELSSTLRK